MPLPATMPKHSSVGGTRYDAAVARGALDDFAGPFHQLWRYYLMYCEGGFRGGAIDVAQITMVKA